MNQRKIIPLQNITKRSFWLKGLALLLLFMLAFSVLSRITASLTVAKVQTEKASRRKIQHTVTAEGRVEKNRELSVMTQAGILVKSVLVSEGERVTEGQVLAELDMEDLQEQIEGLEQEIQVIKLQNEALESNIRQAQQQRSAGIERAQEDYNQALASGQEKLDRAAAELQWAQDELAAFQSEEEARKNSAQVQPPENGGEENPSEENKEAEAAQRLSQLQEALKEKQAAYDSAVEEKHANELTAARQLEDAKAALSSDNSMEINLISIEKLEKQLEKLTELKNQEGKIVAAADGVITQLAIAVGQKTTDTAAATMTDDSWGLRYVAQIDRKDSKYVSAGDSVSLSSISKKVEDVQISSLEADETGEYLTVTVLLPADTLSLGDSATLTVMKESQEYDCTVPLTALYQENNKSFLYVLDRKDTVLGEQYIARKTEVEVLDKNDSYAALESGIVNGDTQIITGMDRYVEAGGRVRLTEE